MKITLNYLDCFASLAMTVITSRRRSDPDGKGFVFSGLPRSFHSLAMTGRENWIATHLPVGKARFARNDKIPFVPSNKNGLSFFSPIEKNFLIFCFFNFLDYN